MKEKFTIRLTGALNGEPIQTSSFDLAEMVRFLDGMLKGVREEATIDHLPKDSSVRLLSLESITDRCAEMSFCFTELASGAVERIADALCNENMDGLAKSTQRTVRHTFQKIINKGAGVQFLNERRSPVYSMTHPLPSPKKESLLVEDAASLVAYIVRIGGKNGATVTATFDATKETRTVECSRRTAKKMSDAGCLYESVSLIGKAEWRTEPWSLVNFWANTFKKHYRGKASKLFGSLDKEFVDSFKSMDVDKYMAEVRGEDVE